MRERVTDYTIKGKCSNCGACCTDFLPVSAGEIQKIRKYVKDNCLKPHTVVPALLRESLDMTCPFRNNAEQKCDIYHIRPQICRTFMCNHRQGDIERNRDAFQDRYKAVSMRDVIFGDPANREYVKVMWMALSQMMVSRVTGKRRGKGTGK